MEGTSPYRFFGQRKQVRDKKWLHVNHAVQFITSLTKLFQNQISLLAQCKYRTFVFYKHVFSCFLFMLCLLRPYTMLKMHHSALFPSTSTKFSEKGTASPSPYPTSLGRGNPLNRRHQAEARPLPQNVDTLMK